MIYVIVKYARIQFPTKDRKRDLYIMNLILIYSKLYTFLLNIAYKKKYCVFLLSILLLVSIDILSYNHIALGSSDSNGDNDDNDNNNDNDNDNNNGGEKEEKEKDNDNDNDDVPFILPVPFPQGCFDNFKYF